MGIARDVLLVVAGAGGTAVAGATAAVLKARLDRRAAQRTRVATQIDEHLALYGDYLLAVDDLVSAIVVEADDTLLAPARFSDENCAETQRARREHERLYNRVALAAPDEVLDAFLAVHDALADLYRCGTLEDPSEEGIKRYRDLVNERSHECLVKLRETYWKYEDSL